MTYLEERPAVTYLFMIALCLFTVEIGLRVFDIDIMETDRISHDYMMTNKETHHDYIPNSKFTIRRSKADGGKRVSSTINSYGIRGPELGDKRHYRVLFVGDSFVQALEVDFENTFGEKLNQHFSGQYEFISHGMSSYSPTTEFSWIHHKGLALKPDEINLFLFINDFFSDTGHPRDSDAAYRKKTIWKNGIPTEYQLPGETQLESSKKVMPTMVHATKHIRLLKILYFGSKRSVRALWTKLRGHRGRPEEALSTQEIIIFSKDASTWPDDLRDHVDETIEVIVRLKQYLEKRRVKLNVLLLPAGWGWSDEVVFGKQRDPYSWSADFSISQQGIEDYLRTKFLDRQINFLNLRPAFEEAKRQSDKPLYFSGDGHWNENGHEVVFKFFRDYYEVLLALL